MLYVKVFVLLFLCLAHKYNVVNSDIYEEINKNVTVSKTTKKYLKKVTLCESTHFNILMPDVESDNYNDLSVYAFYTTINCYVSEKIINWIYTFIREFPLFYQRKFLNTEFDNIYVSNMQTFKNQLIDIKSYIVKYINILHNFIDSNPHAFFFYKDTAVLQTLMALKIKIDFIFKKESIELDKILIQEILEEMNDLQRFVLMRCGTLPNNDSQFYGYSTTIKNEDMSKKITNHIESELFFGLVSQQNDCSVESIFLQNVVTISAKDQISEDIFNMKFIISLNDKSETNTISIKQIWQQIQKSYDIELVYWYQKSIITAIMKLIYHKMLKIIKNVPTNDQTNIIILKINSINLKISEDYKKLPSYLVEGFTLLKDINIKKISEDKYTKILEFYDTIKLNHEIGNKIYENEEYEIFFDKNFEYLDILLKRILENFNDFKCFYQYYKYLQNERDKYYLPFIYTGKNLLSTMNHTPDNTCNFIKDIYLITYKITIYLNRANDTKMDNTYNEYFIQATNAIRSILNYFIIIIREDVQDLVLLKIAYNIVTLLVNQNNFIDINNVYYFQRILYLVMTELNVYGFRCTLTKFNFLLINNIDINFIKMDLKEIVLNEIDNGTTLKHIQIDFSTIKPQHYECHSYTYLYDKFFEHSNIFNIYDDVITANWKGLNKNIKAIYTDIISLFSNPDYFYELYDMILIFIVAIVYYDVKSSTNRALSNVYTVNTGRHKHIDYILHNILIPENLPDNLRPLIEDIQKCDNIAINDTIDDKMNYFNNIQINIETQFNRRNIFFKNENMKNKKVIWSTINNIDDTHIPENILGLYRCYLLYSRYRMLSL